MQKRELLRRTGSPDDRIAVGVAAEAVDDRLVLGLELSNGFVCFGEHGSSLRVNPSGFAVHVRQAKEIALGLREVTVRPLTKCLLSQYQRHPIGRKSPWVSAVQVARQLVEHDDLGQLTLRCRAPAVAFATARSSVAVGEARTNRRVYRGVVREPLPRAQLLKPEI